MRVKFTQFFDVSSSPDAFTTFPITAGGDYVKQRCMPQFACYKYYKLGGVTVKLVPASTLPVDPTGLSYETGETTVDPRDMFNPGLVRITNGEDVKKIGTIEQYYATMLDPRWYKFQLQQGFSRYAKPLVYNIGEIHHDILPFMSENPQMMSTPGFPGVLQKSALAQDNKLTYATPTDANIPLAVAHTPIQTGRIKLGWMPTDAANQPWQLNQGLTGGMMVRVPEVDVLSFVLPKAFKTKFFYRVFVETVVYFKEPVAVNAILDTNGNSVLPIDRFIGTEVVNSGTTGTAGQITTSKLGLLGDKVIP